jgi:hypothetical protein
MEGDMPYRKKVADLMIPLEASPGEWKIGIDIHLYIH